MEVPPLSLTYKKKVTSSSNPNPAWHVITAINNGDWAGHFWVPDANDERPWIEFDLGKPEKVSKVIFFESGKAIKAFEIQYQKRNNLETVYVGDEVESGRAINLKEFTAQKIRVTITAFSEVPGIYEVIFL